MGGIAIRGSSRSVNVVDKLHDSANVYSANKQCMSIDTTPYEPRTSNESFVGRVIDSVLMAHMSIQW